MKKLIYIILFITLPITIQAQEKYAIGMFHFNLQYVAGDYKIETKIIKNSVYPVLQFFEKNPQYKSDIEIQGYAIESLADDHPQVLALLKKLVNRGQIELVIAHYSDQFFIAYPALDLQKSIEISDKILADHGMKRSRVFFGQEIQWTPAYASLLKDKYDLVVTSSDPHGHYRGATLPLVNITYGNDHILGLIGAGETKLDGLWWNFSFLDDGEVFNTLDYNSDFNIVPEQEKKSIDKFKRLEKEGYTFVTMTELANKIKALKGYKIPDYPFVPEGTWNMSVCGPFMWMGRQRTGVEKDGLTRALSYQMRGVIMMAERLVDYAAAQGLDVTKLKGLILEAWKHLLLSEVSDSSGWSPWLVEVQYTDNEVANADLIIKEVLKGLKAILPMDDQNYTLNTQDGKIEPAGGQKINPGTVSTLPIPFGVRAEKCTSVIKKISEDLYRIDIKGERPVDGAVEIEFNTPASGLWYSAGSGEEWAVEIPTDLKNDPAFTLSNGFISLNIGYSLIKDCSVEHIAATWKMKEQKLVFREELNKNNPEMNMRFYLLKGSVNDGLKLANRLNTWPSYNLTFSKSGIGYLKMMPENW
jgi:Glycosyl hydrolase family 57